MGFEPTTFASTGRCSTIELQNQIGLSDLIPVHTQEIHRPMHTLVTGIAEPNISFGRYFLSDPRNALLRELRVRLPILAMSRQVYIILGTEKASGTKSLRDMFTTTISYAMLVPNVSFGCSSHSQDERI
jgi:hypothetical protein